MSSTRLDLPPLERGSSRGTARRLRYYDRLLVPLAATCVALMVWSVLHGNGVAFDFHYAYWLAGHRVMAGGNPWVWSRTQFGDGVAFVYPAVSAVMFAPLSVIPRGAASVLFMLVCVALAPMTLRLLNVRDPRVYAVTMLWLPVYAGWQTANETLFLTFGLACLWRWRDRPLVAGFLVGAMLSLKPLMWPLALWLLVTRRWRASAWTVAVALALNLVAWSIVGFGQIASYLHAAGSDTSESWRIGFGVPALFGHLSLPQTAGIVTMVVLSAALAVAAARAGLLLQNELRALVLTVALAMVSSPLLWSHYVAMLIVPLAVLRPRVDWVWAIPLLLWVCPLGWTVHLWQWLFVWAAVATMVIALVRQSAPLAGARPLPMDLKLTWATRRMEWK
jgi:alpha-1,2-mannosyltransferase